MTKRGLKRIFVFSFYFSIFLILSASFWYLFVREKPKADVCGDQVCGKSESFSSCPSDCAAAQIWENLEVLDKIIVPIQENVYDTAFSIKNPNGAGGVKDLQYRIEFLGENKGEVAFREGRTFILPGDTKHVMELNIESPEKITDLKVSFRDFSWQKLKSDIYREPEIKIKNKIFTFDTERNEYRLIGRVENSSPFDFKEVFVQVFLLDESGKVMAMNYTVQGALLSMEEREFIFSWSKNEISGAIRSERVKGEVNVFDSETFMRRYGEEQPF